MSVSERLYFSIIIPVFNSAEIIPELYQRLVDVMTALGRPFEIIFVEDCSDDNSWEILCRTAQGDPRVRVFQLMRNSGQGSATLAGLSIASGEMVITIDDDLQNPPEEIPVLVDAIEKDSDIDVVIGVPFKKNHGIIRRLGSALINAINSIFLHKKHSLRLTGFRVLRRQVVRILLEMNFSHPVIGPMILEVTRRVVNVQVRHDFRRYGRSGYGFFKILRQTVSNFIGYSMLPLRVLGLFGCAGIAASVFLSCFYLARYFFVGISVPGWTTLLLIMLVLMGFNFFAFAVVGEYLLRIFSVQRFHQPFHIRRQFFGVNGSDDGQDGLY